MDDSSASRRPKTGPRTRVTRSGRGFRSREFSEFSLAPRLKGCPRAPTRKRAPHAMATSHQRSRLATLVLLTILAVRPSPHLASDARPRSPLRVSPDAESMSYSFLNVRATSREVQPDRVSSCLIPPRRVPAPPPRPSVFSFRPPRRRRGRIRALRPRRPSRRAARTRLSVRYAFPSATPPAPTRARSRARGATTRSRTARRSTCGSWRGAGPLASARRGGSARARRRSAPPTRWSRRSRCTGCGRPSRRPSPRARRGLRS